MAAQARKNPALHDLYERLDPKAPLTRVVGLTGGIASGKSFVASLFKKRKVPVIDADVAARATVRPGTETYRQIVAVFGQGILKPDRTVDRMRLGELVFADERRRRLLESITHPEIRKAIEAEIARWRKKKAEWVVVDAALLFESGLYKEMDKNLLVRINPAVQLKRLMKRDRLPEPQAWARILAQMPSAQKEKLADWTVDNSFSRATTKRQALKILDAVRGRRKASARGP